MVFTKKDQFENKFKRVKASVSSKHNLALIVQHDSDLSMKNHSYAGRLQYVIILGEIADFKKKDFEKFDESDLKEFFANLMPLGPHKNRLEKHSPKTRWIYMCLVKSFFKWLYKAEDDDVPVVVKWIKRKHYVGYNRKLLPSEILTPSEVKQLVRAAPFTRDSAFIFSLFESTCRISEFLPLKIKDVKISNRYACFDVKGAVKTSYSERTCYLIRSLPDLRNWLNVHPFRDNPEAPLWPSMAGKSFGQAITINGANHIINRAYKNTNLQKRIFLHLFRHSRALECAVKGYNNQVMNKMFGWGEKSDMASWYVSLSQSDVKNVVLEKEGVATEIEEDQRVNHLDLTECPSCGKEHGAGIKFCTCGFILDEIEASKVDIHKDVKALMMLKDVLKDFKSLQEKGLDKKELTEFIDTYVGNQVMKEVRK